MKTIATAANTVVPSILALESLGFSIAVDRTASGDLFRATRGEETFVAEDPVALLGLVKLIELRSWEWHPGDAEINAVMRRYGLS